MGQPHSEIRRRNFEAQLQEQAILNFRIWPGILKSIPVAGISKAHKQIVQWAKDNKLPDVCIMEDDVAFYDKNGFNSFVSEKPEDYDIYITGISGGTADKVGIIKGFTGMSLYFVHERFYDTFLAVPETKNIDSALSGLGKYIARLPNLCYQIDGYSYNKKRVKKYSHLFK